MTIRIAVEGCQFLVDDSFTPPRVVGMRQRDGSEQYFPFVDDQPSATPDALSSLLYSARVLFRLTAADLNVTTDQQFTKLGEFTNWLPLRLHVVNASASAASAVGGVYSAAAKGGAAIVAASSAFTGITGANQGQAFGNANGAGGDFQTATPYLSLSTPHGSAVTADAYMLGFILS